MKYVCFLVVWMSLVITTATGQSVDGNEIRVLQDSLVKLGHVMYNEPSEPERLQANFTFVKTLVTALRIAHSYDFPFDDLNMVSILPAPDDTFRLFSWHLQLNDGSYLYYGAVQLKTADGSLRMFPLLDKTYEIADPESSVVSSDTWYGAQYYRMVPINGDYLLLGWKGHTPEVTQKVVEVLRLEDDGIRLGSRIFNSEETLGHARLIYRYSRQASMLMDYDAEAGHIIVDHLAPADPQYIGEYAYYGPDMTYDAWQLKDGKLELVSDIPFANLPDSNDEFYNDPKRPATHPKSGFPSQ